MKNNKIFRRFISILLIILMLSSSMVVSAAADTTKVTFGEAMGKAGGEVTVPVTIKNNPGIATYRFRITYDTDALTYVSSSQSAGFADGVLSDYADVASKTVTFLWYSTQNVYGDGELFRFTFRFSDTAVGDFPLAVTYLQEDMLNEERMPIGYAVESGEVYVGRAVSGISLSDSTLSLKEDETAVLSASVFPDRVYNAKVIWKSSDNSVAKVDQNGKVTAVKYGSAVITATTEDGGFSDHCSVQVACVHKEKTAVEAKAATCKLEGWSAYYICDGCGQIFDEDGTTKLDAVPKTEKDPDHHVNKKQVAAETSTCVHMGHDAYEICLDCNTVTSGSNAEYYGDHSYGALIPAVLEKHTPSELVAAVGAHYRCSLCYKYFTETKTETTLDALTGMLPSHDYGDWITTDSDQHWKQCDCGHKIEIFAHDYENACDTTCNTCGATRSVGSHEYDNACDALCNICNAQRTVGPHEYDNACDTNCNNCQAVRSITHQFGSYVYDNNATATADGTKTRTCSVCGHTETIIATGTKWKNPFKDVKTNAYYYTPVLWAVANRITSGVTSTSFAPEDPCTRGQIVTFLWRAAGSPNPKGNNNPFKDVKSNAYYYKAVLWAVENGITTGTSSTTFSPEEACTRGQIVTFLWRAKESPKPQGSQNPFKDVKSGAYYYKAVLWAVENGITTGTSSTAFSPEDSCTRGQIVTFLYRSMK